MPSADLAVAMSVVGNILWDFCTKIGGVFVAIAAFDAFYQRKRYTKDNMMSKYDVKQEYKQSEGDPHHKAERKRFHQEILNSASPAAVKNADVVVRNPEHIAVALKYDKEKEGAAPKVVAKGERMWAEKILESARAYGIPVVRNVPLAQALNKLDVGEEVPEELYEAVAEVLNFVYGLSQEQERKKAAIKGKRAEPAQAPAPPVKLTRKGKNP
ncbi:MAG: EscU/YscU/HrcU family type III secretion system export apparatus switch protein [Deltaproteobacteria bacterium]|nr:EscU/YscU/HrcU family type III secretion system export apparatus switch protein [Deltaproteobacteria bacterium]